MAHASGLKDFGVTRGLSKLRGTLSSSSAWRNVEPGTPEAWYYSNFGVCVLGTTLELAADLMPWLTDRELEYLMSNYWAPEDRVLKEMKEGKFLG